MTGIICPKTGLLCRHCSLHQFMNVSRVSNIKTGELERRVSYVNFGEFCNNDGKHYVKDLKECPMPGALAMPVSEAPAGVDELTWMKIHGSS